MTIKQKGSQTIMGFDWVAPVHYKQAFLVPKKHIDGWDKEGDEGYINGLNQNLTANGGKISVFRISVKGKTGYKVFDGYDELNRFFEVKFM